jgi:hypothetical protein
MTGDLFTKMMTAFDEKSAVKRAMIVDNAGSHTIEVTQEKLLNTLLIHLPPNTTALMQPNDQGIIAAFKAQYRKQMLRQVLSVLQARIDEAADSQIPRTLAAEVLAHFVTAFLMLLLGCS